jgi:isopentenyl-diphosphate delta-isomerase
MEEKTNLEKILLQQDDPNAASRKKDHIELALKSQSAELDNRFYYEPLMSAHPQGELTPVEFLGKEMKAPIWISSMTGGTEVAGKINKNLAKACAEFGLGMGLGSTRKLLESDEYFDDFNLRDILGDDRPFYANLGIAQVEKLIAEKATDKIDALLEKLRADGLFIHVNPFQEWLQPEGDKITLPPIQGVRVNHPLRMRSTSSVLVTQPIFDSKL